MAHRRSPALLGPGSRRRSQVLRAVAQAKLPKRQLAPPHPLEERCSGEAGRIPGDISESSVIRAEDVQDSHEARDDRRLREALFLELRNTAPRYYGTKRRPDW